MNEIFLKIAEISATTSIVILLVAILSNIIDRKYTAGWKYWIWIIIAVRLLVPLNPGSELFEKKVEVEVPNVSIYVPAAFSNGTNLSTNPEMIIPEQNSGAQNSEIPKDQVLKPSKREAEGREKTTLLNAAAFVWVSGAVLMFIWNIGSYLVFRKVTIYKSVPASSKIKDLLLEVKTSLGIKKDIKAIICKNVSSPMIMGFLSPRLVLPGEDYSEEAIRFILRHELTHYKRRDTFYKAFMLLVNSVHWFNPVIWLMRKLADSDLEVSCDSKVVSGADIEIRKLYSETILSCVHKEKAPCAVFSTHFYGGAKTLKKRFANILSTEKRGKGKIAFALVLILALVLGGTVACTASKAPTTEQIRELVLKADAVYQPGDDSVLETVSYENYINEIYYDEIGNFEEAVSGIFTEKGIEQILSSKETVNLKPAFFIENGRYYRYSSVADSTATNYYYRVEYAAVKEENGNSFVCTLGHYSMNKAGESEFMQSYVTIVFENGKYLIDNFDSKRFVEVNYETLDEEIVNLVKKAEAVYQPGNREVLKFSGLNNFYLDFPGQYDQIRNYDDVIFEIFTEEGISQLKNSATKKNYYPVIYEKDGKIYRVSSRDRKDDVLYYDTIYSTELIEENGNKKTYKITHVSSESVSYISNFTVVEKNGKYLVEYFENRRFDKIHYQTQEAREIWMVEETLSEHISLINEQLESFRNGTFVENPMEPDGWPDYFPPVYEIPEMNTENLALVWRNPMVTENGEQEGIVWFLYRVDSNYALIFEPLTFEFIDRTENGIQTSFVDAGMYGYENIDEWFDSCRFEGIYGGGFMLREELYSEPEIIAEHIIALNQLSYENYGAVLDGKTGTFLFNEYPEDISVTPDEITYDPVVYDGVTDMYNGYYLDPFERTVQEVLNFSSLDEMYGYMEQYISEDFLNRGYNPYFMEFDGKLYKAVGNHGNIGITYCNCEIVSQTESYMTVESDIIVAYSGENYGTATIEFEKVGEDWKIIGVIDRIDN